MTEDNKIAGNRTKDAEKEGFFRNMLRLFRNLLVLAMILVPCGYAVKLQLRLSDSLDTVDSLRTALNESRAMLDSLKVMKDNEILMRDSLDDLVDRKLDEAASVATIMIDTTLDWLVARKAIEDKLALNDWIDTLCASYPEGVAAHVKLHYLQSRAIRMERLNHHYSTRFPEHQESLQDPSEEEEETVVETEEE